MHPLLRPVGDEWGRSARIAPLAPEIEAAEYRRGAVVARVAIERYDKTPRSARRALAVVSGVPDSQYALNLRVCRRRGRDALPATAHEVALARAAFRMAKADEVLSPAGLLFAERVFLRWLVPADLLDAPAAD